MKIKKLLTPLILLSLALTSCGGTPQELEEIDTSYYFIFGNNYDTEAKFTYKNDYFRAPTSDFDTGLALMSFIATANSGQKKEMKKFYNKIHFKDHYYTSVYDTGCGTDTYGFYMASREIDDFTLIALSFRSYDYTLEWVSNVNLGTTGNHAGFEYSVNNAMQEFERVVNEKYAGKNLKLWVNGFSRGGAEANMFATKLIDAGTFGFNEDNVYCYTFEAPAGLSEENRRDYKNIWNCANKADIVVNVPPAAYHLYRSGTDVDILERANYNFDQLYADYMHETYPKDSAKAQEFIDMIPSFQSSTSYSNDTQFMAKFIEKILENDDPDYGIHERADYVAHLQDAAMFLTELFYGMEQFAIYFIMNDFQKRYLDSASHMLQLANIILKDDGAGLYEIAKTYLDFVEYPYNDAQLRVTCRQLYNIVTKIGFGDVTSIIGALPNIQRGLYYHWHEANYVLIREMDRIAQAQA